MATVTSSKRQLTHTSNTYESNGDVTIGGNLNINGTTTTIDTANLLVEDKNIIIGDVSSPSDTTADGGGITLKGASDKTINWVNSTDSWTSNQRFSAPNLTLTSLTTSSETTALLINGSNQVVKRTLGSNAFNSTSFLTGNQTITLSGDVSGSGTTSISVTVADDSHNHIISNVDGLQSALDGKATAGDENIIDGATSIWNADGDGDVFTYNDSNPTHNSKGTGAVIYIRGDGTNDHSLVRAGIFTSDHVSTANGYYVGTLLGTGNSTTTQVINSSGAWTGSVIPAAKLSTATTQSSSENSTKIATTAYVKDQGYTANSGTVTSVTVNTAAGLDGAGTITSSGTVNLSLDLSELTDMTGAINTSQDELILLDNGAERRKLFSEIFGSNAYNSTTIPTNNNQLTNGASYITGNQTITLSGDVSGSGETSISVTVNDDSHNHHRLDSTDDRDVKPNTTGIGASGVQAIKPFFTTFNGMTGSSGGAYQDMIALDTYSDSSGGGPSAMTFSKSASVGSPQMYIWKGAYGGTTWGTGQRVFADNYHPNADRLTTGRTISLGGDLSGSAEFTGAADITITAAVGNDSHTHDGRYYTETETNGFLNLKANLASPALTGNPTAPTQAANNNSTRIATTAYVQTEIGDLIGGAPGALDTLNELAAAINDDASYASTITTALAAKAPLASPALTGAVTVSGSGSSGNALVVYRGSDSSAALRVQNTGEVVVNNNYLYAASSGTSLYVQNNAVFRGSISNDGSGEPVTIGDDLYVSSDLTIGSGSSQSNLHIKKADNDVSDHIVFYNGTTRVGEIGVEDNDYLRINQETAKNIYTPRFIRADGGFLVDGTSKGIDGSGNFFGGTITGASDANVSNWNTAYGWGNHASAGYLTSSSTQSKYLRSDATDTATGALTLSNQNNHYSGHHYFDPYASNGTHYPHYLHGSSGSAKVNIRVYNAGGGSYDVLYIAAGSNDMTWRGNKIWNAGNDGSGSGLDADKLDGLELHTGRNNEANKVVRTDGNGYIQAGWINTTSGANTTQAINRVYASTDSYIRYYSAADFGAGIGQHISYNDLTNKPTIPSAYSLPLSSSSTRGGVKIGFSESGKNYPVELDSSEKMFVNVPWTDTNTDTNTTYSAGTGLTLSGTTFSITDTISDSASNSTIVKRKSGGYIFANYFNTTPNTVSSGITQICVETGNDGYIRHGTAAAVRSFINVASGATANTGTLTSVGLSVGTGLDGGGTVSGSSGSFNTITLDLSELTDMTGAINTSEDELILLDNGAERRKRFSEIFGSNAYNSTTIPTNNNQLTNGAGYVTTDTNTTYSAGRGLDLSGTEFQLETDLRDSISYIGYDSNDYVQWSNNSYFRSVVNGSERFRVNTSGIDVNGTTTSSGFLTDTSSTQYNLLTRNNTSNTLYVQAAQSGSTQGIATFRYGSTTANAGTEVLAVRRNSSYFINTKLGVGTSSPQTSLDVSGTIHHTIYNATGLPSASPAGQRAFAYSYYPLATSHGSVVSTNGSYVIPVYSDGSSWRAG